MAQFPCLPLWTDSYLADTQHLTTEEHGAYLLLLIQAWRTPNCSLPDDDAMLSRLAGMTAAKWKASKAIIMAFWTLDKRRKRWVQKRLQKERSKAAKRKHLAKDNAVTGWNARKKTLAKSMPERCSPKPKPTSKDKSFSEGARAPKKSLVDQIAEVWEDA